MLVLVRPRFAAFTWATFRVCVVLGVVTATVTLFVHGKRLPESPLGTASALEFLGPLAVAFAHGKGPTPHACGRGLAAVGVVLLTQPWAGAVDPIGVLFALGAAVCWACYILLTQRAGDEVSGINALAVSMARRRPACDRGGRSIGVAANYSGNPAHRRRGWRSCCRRAVRP